MDSSKNSGPGLSPELSPELRAEIESLYAEVDREIAATTVVCWTRGLCCDFEKVDHVLYASTVELAYVRDAYPEPFPAGSTLCPFWREGLCTLRERRPLGCRTYFCDERFNEPLQAIYERFHARLKALAIAHDVPWAYMPFVAELRRDER